MVEVDTKLQGQKCKFITQDKRSNQRTNMFQIPRIPTSTGQHEDGWVIYAIPYIQGSTYVEDPKRKKNLLSLYKSEKSRQLIPSPSYLITDVDHFPKIRTKIAGRKGK